MYARFHRHVLAALAATVALIAVPTGAAAAVITFDDVTAPPLFSDAVPLTNQYSPQGVTFSGTGAVLDAELSDFLLTGATDANNILGYSGFTAIDFGSGVESKSFDVLTFDASLRSVSFDVGSGLFPIGMFNASAFNSMGMLVDSTDITLTSMFQRVSLVGTGITRVRYGFDDEFAEFAIDNLVTTADVNGAPVPEPMTLSLFVTALGVMAVARRRRN